MFVSSTGDIPESTINQRPIIDMKKNLGDGYWFTKLEACIDYISRQPSDYGEKYCQYTTDADGNKVL